MYVKNMINTLLFGGRGREVSRYIDREFQWEVWEITALMRLTFTGRWEHAVTEVHVEVSL